MGILKEQWGFGVVTVKLEHCDRERCTSRVPGTTKHTIYYGYVGTHKPDYKTVNYYLGHTFSTALCNIDLVKNLFS